MVSHWKKARSRRYPTEAITDAGYADNFALLVNTPAQAESLRHSLEQAELGIGLYMNSDKTEFMCFKEDAAISKLNDEPLKLVDHFTCLGSNISSIESDVNIRIGKVWVDRLSIM